MSTWVVINHTMTFISLIISIVSILMGKYDTSKWILPLDLVVPFNTESVFGWYWLWFYNLQLNIAYSVCLALTISHFICGCFYICGICEHSHFLVQSLKNLKSVQTEDDGIKNQKRNLQIKQTLCEFIDTQNNVFE